MDEVLGVQVLDAVDHLVGQHEHRLQAELAVAEAEKVLQGRPEEVNDHDVVVALYAVPMHVGDANAAGQDLVELGLIEQLRVLGLDRL